MSAGTGGPVGMEAFFEISTWLTWEAALLDEGRFQDWLALVADDIRYRMPVTVTTARGNQHQTLGGMFHFDEDQYSLAKRVERLTGDHAWTEDPPSRTRRFVTNVRGYGGESPDELVARSYLLLFRSRLDVRPAEWLAAERVDVLRRDSHGDGLRLARRDITVDESVLPTQNLALFL